MRKVWAWLKMFGIFMLLFGAGVTFMLAFAIDGVMEKIKQWKKITSKQMI